MPYQPHSRTLREHRPAALPGLRSQGHLDVQPPAPPQVITLEGWVDIMYYVMDAHSFYNFIYFILLIIVSTGHVPVGWAGLSQPWVSESRRASGW